MQDDWWIALKHGREMFQARRPMTAISHTSFGLCSYFGTSSVARCVSPSEYSQSRDEFGSSSHSSCTLSTDWWFLPQTEAEFCYPLQCLSHRAPSQHGPCHQSLGVDSELLQACQCTVSHCGRSRSSRFVRKFSSSTSAKVNWIKYSSHLAH